MAFKIEYLFLLEELFQKANLSEIYLEFLSNKIKEIGIKNIPDNTKVMGYPSKDLKNFIRENK